MHTNCNILAMNTPCLTATVIQTVFICSIVGMSDILHYYQIPFRTFVCSTTADSVSHWKLSHTSLPWIFFSFLSPLIPIVKKMALTPEILCVGCTKDRVCRRARVLYDQKLLCSQRVFSSSGPFVFQFLFGQIYLE